MMGAEIGLDLQRVALLSALTLADCWEARLLAGRPHRSPGCLCQLCKRKVPARPRDNPVVSSQSPLLGEPPVKQERQQPLRLDCRRALHQRRLAASESP